MKDKRGFVFVETIIVIATVLAGLLAIYVSYTNMVRNERRRVRYDDPAFIYKTHTIGRFLLSMYDNDGNAILSNKIKEHKAVLQLSYTKASEDGKNPIEEISNYYFNILPNDIDFFSSNYVGNNASRRGFYHSLTNNLNIQNVIVIRKKEVDLIYTNKDNSIIKNLIPNNLLYYILSLNTSDDDDEQMYLIVEFAEKTNGDACSPTQLSSSSSETKRESSCTYYYSNISNFYVF